MAFRSIVHLRQRTYAAVPKESKGWLAAPCRQFHARGRL